MTKKGTLILIPNLLDEDNSAEHLVPMVADYTLNLTHFVAESDKKLRQLLRKLHKTKDLNNLVIYPMDTHSGNESLNAAIRALKSGIDVGVVSDAGLPCIADPGAVMVGLAHASEIKVIPLPGASSIIMALMASGMGGQSFTFNGYLSLNQQEKQKELSRMEADARRNKITQIFMETPYRNNQLLDNLLEKLNPDTRLCIACSLTSKDEFIVTKTIKNWKHQKPDLHKKPCIFVMG